MSVVNCEICQRPLAAGYPGHVCSMCKQGAEDWRNRDDGLVFYDEQDPSPFAPVAAPVPPASFGLGKPVVALVLVAVCVMAAAFAWKMVADRIEQEDAARTKLLAVGGPGEVISTQSFVAAYEKSVFIDFTEKVILPDKVPDPDHTLEYYVDSGRVFRIDAGRRFEVLRRTHGLAPNCTFICLRLIAPAGHEPRDVFWTIDYGFVSTHP